MPAKPAPIKKAVKKELPKKVEKAPEPVKVPEPAPAPAPEPEVPVEAPPAEAPPAEAPPAEAPPAEAPPAEEAAPAAPAEEAPAAPAEPVVVEPPAPPPAGEACTEPEATAEPAASAEPDSSAEPTASAEPVASTEPDANPEPNANPEPKAKPEPAASAEPEANAEPDATTEPTACTEPAANAEPAASTDPNATAEPATETPAPEEPKAPTPPLPPPKEPTSAPVDLFIEDKNDTSVSIIWSQPATVGDSGLDGYTIEVCKDGTEDWKAVNEELQKSCRFAIKNQTTGDRLKIRVVAVNAGGRSAPVTLPEAILVKEVADRPKIRMPRFLRQRYVANVGEKINLTIPFSGKPKPVVTWTKNGQPVDTKRVNVRSTGHDSILFIRQSERDDSGVYEMSVKVDDFEDKASLILQIVELPGAPSSVKIVDSWGFNAAVEWTPPADSGNTVITGYTIQKSDKKTGDWFTVLEHTHRLNATVSDLVMGNTYTFRVYSENKCGLSESCVTTKEEAKILKTVINYTPPEYKDPDSTEAPKFTTPLIDRAATVGFNTKLLCAVRGSPKPKIEWLKNQLVIGDDPKFKQIFMQGICSLEIRKPGNFDGGVYACRAKNSHGEATVVCHLEVKQPINPEAK